MRFLRRSRFVVAAATVALLAGCTSVDTGFAVRDVNYDPLAVNATLLDTGPYATEPTELGSAGDVNTGRRLESVRLAEYVTLPFDADPTLVVGGAVRTGDSGPLVGASSFDLGDLLGSPTAPAKSINTDELIAGFGYRAGMKEGVYKATNNVLRFATADQAQQTADRMMTAAAVGFMDESITRPVEVPGHPETRALLERTSPTSSLAYVTAITVRGDIIISQYITGSSTESDAFGGGEKLAGKILDLQIPLLEKYQPTPVDKLAELPQDPTGLLGRTVPMAQTESSTVKAKVGTYGPRSALAYQLDIGTSSAAFESAGMSTMLLRGTRIFVTNDNASARELTDVLGAEALSDKRIATEGINGFPSAECYEVKKDEKLYEAHNYCMAAVGKYVIVSSADETRAARQMLSAQYVLLPDDAK
ncbi:DUF7373 family lipoprotein [Mycolicibacterium brumae]|uniref:DUF7373 family lipoprotein n=1 Tax=Mycolicibacterium brumae TaxID=85968 RepID=UPI000FE2317E|nr:hypothetical protein [Mycolicibacterium brumae]MCV7192666.1 hypothetical protein [Mycolicibacterium brumae]UWW08819.1 hypothetical protein L2Z93_001890 [Mycolicibacterium brumae]